MRTGNCEGGEIVERLAKDTETVAIELPFEIRLEARDAVSETRPAASKGDDT